MVSYADDHQIISRLSSKCRDPIRDSVAVSLESWSDFQIVVEHAVAQSDGMMGRSITAVTPTPTVLSIRPTLKRIETTFTAYKRPKLIMFKDDRRNPT